jgi:hypothetical protein
MGIDIKTGLDVVAVARKNHEECLAKRQEEQRFLDDLREDPCVDMYMNIRSGERLETARQACVSAELRLGFIRVTCVVLVIHSSLPGNTSMTRVSITAHFLQHDTRIDRHLSVDYHNRVNRLETGDDGVSNTRELESGKRVFDERLGGFLIYFGGMDAQESASEWLHSTYDADLPTRS